MASKIEKNPRWVELQNMGYNLRDKDGDVAVVLYFKEAYITDFNQTKGIMDEIIKEAEQHRQEIMGSNEPAEMITE